MLGLLAQETITGAPDLSAGRAVHRGWVEAVFAPLLGHHASARRDALVDQLTVATYVYIAGALAGRGHAVAFLGHPQQEDLIRCSGYAFQPFRHARPWSASAPAPGFRGLLRVLSVFADRVPGLDLAELVARARPTWWWSTSCSGGRSARRSGSGSGARRWSTPSTASSGTAGDADWGPGWPGFRATGRCASGSIRRG